MARKISIFRYIAENNPSGALSLLEDYNVKGRYSDSKSITNGLKTLAKSNDGKILIKKVLSIHPDRHLFNKQIQEILDLEKESLLKKEISFVNAEGNDGIKKQNTDIKVTNIAVGLLIGFGVTIGIVGLVKMIK